MPRGYRCIILAAVGWLSLAAAPHPDAKAETPNPKATQKATQSAPAITATPQAVKEVEPPKKQPRCGPRQYGDDDDLCAQWKAADAAGDAAWWAMASFWIGVTGTGGLLASIYYTRRAVLAAVTSNENAQEALAHAKNMAEIELRPYLHIDAISFQEVDLISVNTPISITVRNFGSTPATRFRIEAGADLRNTAKTEHPARSIRLRRYPSVDEIPPGHAATITVPGPIRNGGGGSNSAIFCSVLFHYADKFGSDHKRWETYRADASSYGKREFRFFAPNQG